MDNIVSIRFWMSSTSYNLMMHDACIMCCKLNVSCVMMFIIQQVMQQVIS